MRKIMASEIVTAVGEATVRHASMASRASKRLALAICVLLAAAAAWYAYQRYTVHQVTSIILSAKDIPIECPPGMGSYNSTYVNGLEVRWASSKWNRQYVKEVVADFESDIPCFEIVKSLSSNRDIAEVAVNGRGVNRYWPRSKQSDFNVDWATDACRTRDVKTFQVAFVNTDDDVCVACKIPAQP